MRYLVPALFAASLLSAASPARFQPRHILKTVPGCASPEACTYIDLSFVELVSGTPELRKRVDGAILRYILSRPNGDRRAAQTPEQYADEFLKDFLALKKNGETGDQTWSIDKSVTPLRTSGPILSLECSESAFVGGAHGSAATTYLNLDAVTGAPRKLADLLKPNSVPALTRIAEKYFREARELSPTADLEKEGFSFEAGRFHLNENFGLDGTHLYFTYNQYEIAPYVMGPTEVKIPLAEIRHLLR
jgi:hypothetical protein